MSDERIDNLNAAIADYKTRTKRALVELNEIEESVKPTRERFHAASTHLSELIEKKIKLTQTMEARFDPEELIFSASTRCECGAGLAYPDGIGINGSWYCADILQGKAQPKSQADAKEHTSPLPFAFYEIKSERDGITTRN